MEKKPISQGVVVSHKMRNYCDCTKDSLCENCDKLVNKKKEVAGNPNELKKEAPNQFGQLLPKYL